MIAHREHGVSLNLIWFQKNLCEPLCSPCATCNDCARRTRSFTELDLVLKNAVNLCVLRAQFFNLVMTFMLIRLFFISKHERYKTEIIEINNLFLT